jgi:hypothetical protein
MTVLYSSPMSHHTSYPPLLSSIYYGETEIGSASKLLLAMWAAPPPERRGREERKAKSVCLGYRE